MCITNTTFLHAFQKQAARTPEHIALSDASGVAITYSQTQNYANHVSRKLSEAGVGKGNIVAIFLGRTVFFPIAAIGVFQAGAAYMPIDPRYPDDRIAFMLEDSEAKVLISSRDLVSHAAGYKGLILYAEDLWVEEKETPEPAIGRDDMDYIIYTSGTTGKPKGAMNLHRGLMNLCEFYAEELKFTEQDVSGVYCSFGFDVSVMQMFPFLAKGAKVDIVPTEVMLDMPKLSAYTNEHGLTIMYLPPSIIKFFDPFCADTTLKSVVAIGDRLNYGPGKNFVIYNMYGPAEASVVITTFLVDKEYENYPIGQFVKNNCGYIVDEAMNLAAEGEAGELCLAGVHVGTGYLKRPELTAEKFVQNPFSNDPDYQTLYKTGDLCRLLPDGNYEFLGRIDTQVKIRGFRVELGEIETTMLKYEGINEAICAAFEDEGRGEKYIVGYYTGEKEIDEGALKTFLSQTLPYYMIPVSFVNLEAIPLNGNDKYDRKALIAPVRAGQDQGVFQAGTQEEKVLAECLSELWHTDHLDFEQTFSEAGGDSLGAIELLSSLIEKQFTIDIIDIIDPNHTLRDIARLLVPHTAPITKKLAGTWEKPTEWTDEQFNRVLKQYGRENIERIYNVGALQNLMLGYCLAHPEVSANQMQMIYRVEGPLDIEVFADAFAVIQKKYPVLKTVIAYPSTHPKQLIISNKGLEISIMRDESLDKVIERSYTEGLDFNTLFRVVLLKEQSRYTYVIINIHHIITDGWSIGMILDDLAEFYRKLLKGASLTVLMEEAEQWSKTIPSYEDFLSYANTTLDQEAAVSYFANLVEGYEGYQAKPHIIPDYDGSRPVEGTPQAIEYLAIPHHITEGIRAIAHRLHVNVASVYEGVYAFMAYTESGSSDLMYRRVSTGRSISLEKIRSISGTFVATPPTRVRFSADMTFAELFKAVEKQFNSDMRYEYADFAKMLERIGADILVYSPYFSYEQLPYVYKLTDEVSLYPYAQDTIESIDIFMITVQPMVGSALNNLRIQYNKSRYSQATIKRFMNAYLFVLEYVTSHADAKLSQAPIQRKEQGEHTQKYELMLQMLKEELALIRGELSSIRQEVSRHH